MKLWHDDVRPAPPGWTWARTNAAARDILENPPFPVTEVSLDHDLGYDGPPPGQCDECGGVGRDGEFACAACDGDGFIGGDVLYIAGTSDEDGRDLVRWMIETDHVPPKVTIHSWNPSGAHEMAVMLRDAGHRPRVVPYEMPRDYLNIWKGSR